MLKQQTAAARQFRAAEFEYGVTMARQAGQLSTPDSMSNLGHADSVTVNGFDAFVPSQTTYVTVNEGIVFNLLIQSIVSETIHNLVSVYLRSRHSVSMLGIQYRISERFLESAFNTCLRSTHLPSLGLKLLDIILRRIQRKLTKRFLSLLTVNLL